MKKLYEQLSKALIVMLVTIIPLVSLAQTTPTKNDTKATKDQAKKEEPKKEEQKKEEQKKVRDLAPSNTYWAVTAYGALDQFNGDLSKNLLFNDKWMFGAGGIVTRQFGRVIGARVNIGWAPLSSSVTNKYLPEAGYVSPYISQKFTSYVIQTDLEVTVNWINWILGSKPERFFSSYLIGGIGFDHAQGTKWDTKADTILAYLGYPTHKGAANLGTGNNSGIGGWNLQFQALAGIGFDFNINKHWSINPEFTWRWTDGDNLDLTNGGSKPIKQDMYSGVQVGLTYKFCYGGCSLKTMEKNYTLVKFETTPAVLVEKGDSVTVTVKGTFPEKYFCPKSCYVFPAYAEI